MARRSEELKKQVNVLWKQAVGQLDDVRSAVMRQTGRFEADVQRLRGERDRLLTQLGAQTYRLANQGKVPLPAIVKTTVERLNDVLGRMVAHEARQDGAKAQAAHGGAAAPAKKARKSTGRSGTKKTGKRSSAKRPSAGETQAR